MPLIPPSQDELLGSLEQTALPSLSEGDIRANEQASISSLVTWSMIDIPIRVAVVREWISGRWHSLREFCRHHSLDFQSIYYQFRSRGIPTIIENPRDAGEEIGEALSKHVSVIEDYAVVAKLAMAQLTHRLMTESIPLGDILKIMSRVSSDSAKGAFTVTALQQVELSDQSTSLRDVTSREKTVLNVPDSLKKELGLQFSNYGEHLVRQLESIRS